MSHPYARRLRVAYVKDALKQLEALGNEKGRATVRT